MDPLSTGLAGIALVQKSVEFIQSNISTAQSVKDIAGAIDGLFASRFKRNGLVAKVFLDIRMRLRS